MDRKGLKKVPIEDVEDIFSMAGEPYGYVDVHVKPHKYKGIIIRWKRSYTWIQFDIAYNLLYAPVWFITEVAERMFRAFVEGMPAPSLEAQKWVEENKYRWSQ